MSLEIIPAHPAAVERIDGVKIGIPALAYIGVDNGAPVGSGGLAWGNGRCWIWFRISEPKCSYALPVIRQAKRLLSKAKQLGELEIYTPRDAQYLTSERLLTKLGFQFHSMENDVEIWRYEWP